MSKKKNVKTYEKKDQIEHVILRPDMYVGSVRLRQIDEYIAQQKDNEYQITQKPIKCSPGLLRIFIEPLSNAIDNVERSKTTPTPCTKIKVTIDKTTGETSVWNDGDVIPIEIHEIEGCYNHTLIFGQMLTGSSYNDEEERMIAGRNGLGVKLCSIFSKQFEVESCDPDNGKKFSQVWTNNMRTVNKPKIKSTKLTKGYTKVTWTPDFKLFNIKGYSNDIVALYTRHILDAAMLSGVSVYLNGTIIPIKNISQYATLYLSPDEIQPEEKILIKTKDCTVLVTSSAEAQVISFVNGIYTRLGGLHVDVWCEAIFRPIVEKFNGKAKKTKAPKINISDVRQCFRIFNIANTPEPFEFTASAYFAAV